MQQIDVSPLLRSMETELRACSGDRAGQLLRSLERWSRDAALNDESRGFAQRLEGRARFRVALANSTAPGPQARREAAVTALRQTAPERPRSGPAPRLDGRETLRTS